ncbi:SDR family oxidoreductase [Flaviflexus salsibiostraticola]|uniref:SDR family oxidoreductase n=1 Tax=Flaviflexus salsibiostraticola TaxID=1282737 RepID=A0A3Q8WV69_9ACTO|nr:SDR family oxidoreductase [Flaviflexus salsibiostraticola]AZN30649.1 SDR family oxidoreductase [Flaviflexus salsibiostraticola]
MKHLIFGGHGRVALLASTILVGDGHTVTSIIRNPDHAADVERTGATPLVLDVETADREDLVEAMRGHDAIIWSAGAGGGNPARTRAVDLEAATRSMDAAKEAGVSRYVMVSYLNSRLDHGIPESEPFYTYAQSKAEADEHLRGSGLDYTILGPGSLTLEEPTGRITVIEGGATGSTDTSRGNVALAIAAALDSPASIGRTIGFIDGDTPIADVFS